MELIRNFMKEFTSKGWSRQALIQGRLYDFLTGARQKTSLERAESGWDLGGAVSSPSGVMGQSPGRQTILPHFYLAACNADAVSEENSVRLSVCLSVCHTRDP